MPDLLLHIGHVKTGSTWLQEAFRQSADRLAEHGIRYPRPRGADYNRQTPSGNAASLLDTPQRIDRSLARAVPDSRQTTLFSSEILFNRLSGQRSVGALAAAARDLGFERVRLLMFTRAPLPLAASIWQQRIKGWRGETRDLDDFAHGFNMPQRVLAFAEDARATEGVELVLLNYDAHRRDLVAPVEAWLGLPEEILERPERERMNRSLTRAEAALQVALNRTMGPSQEIFAVRLSNRLPDLPPDPPRISPEVARAILDQCAEALDSLDALLPDGEALDRTVPAEADERPLALAPEQMEVIAEGIAAYLHPSLRTRAWRLGRTIRRALSERRLRRG